MENPIPVLIVGAGPSGLTLAVELARRHIPFRLIDKKSSPTQSSNATWIHTRTLEILDQIGIADRFIRSGHLCDAINLYAEGKPISRLPLNQIDSHFRYILMLAQSDTEKLLSTYLKELNCTVERSIELIHFDEKQKQISAVLKHENGAQETVPCRWLIACDGANSLIREKSGLHFSGEDLKEEFIVADATINFSFMPKDEIHFFFDEGTLLAAFPMGSNRYRIIANLNLGYTRKIFTAREVIEIVQERAHGKYYVTDVTWISPFWIHSKVVENMQQGSIFLIGDAAHIYPPAAGQGMNSGIQDAVNLAWKLAEVIQGSSSTQLLNSYHQERYPVIKHSVEKNESLTKMALFDPTFISSLKKFSDHLDNNQDLSKKISNWLSQIDISYANSSIIDYANELEFSSLQPGEHAPDVCLSNQQSLYQYFHCTRPIILIFTGKNPSAQISIAVNNFCGEIKQKYPKFFELILVTSEHTQNECDQSILDFEMLIHTAYGVTHPCYFIIRPDGYIAACKKSMNLTVLAQSLKTILCRE